MRSLTKATFSLYIFPIFDWIFLMKRASRLSALAVIASLTFSGLTAPNAFAASDSQADPAPANNAQNAPAAPAMMH